MCSSSSLLEVDESIFGLTNPAFGAADTDDSIVILKLLSRLWKFGGILFWLKLFVRFVALALVESMLDSETGTPLESC